MNILLTNDDGYEAPGLRAALQALQDIGRVHVVAPRTECSACSHRITLRKNIRVEKKTLDSVGEVFSVDGTPADCVRLAVAGLIGVAPDLVVSGVNAGANSGIDVFYSGTVAGAREAALLGIPAMAFSQSLRSPLKPDWTAVAEITAYLVKLLREEPLPGPGFWSINLPAPIPANARERIRRVPLEPAVPPMQFERIDLDGGRAWEYRDTAAYWTRPSTARTDYTTIRDGDVAISAVPLHGRF
jgi:5'-nucleotidase